MKILEKARMAGAVMLATAGIAAGTAQADSLLAPLVVDDTQWDTYFAFKMQGQNGWGAITANPNTGFFGPTPQDLIHYTWIRKGSEFVHLLTDFVDLGPTVADNDDTPYGPRPCVMTDNNGTGTRADVIFQGVGPGQAGSVVNVGSAFTDNSRPANHGYGANSFAGMAVIDDQANIDSTGQGSSAPEGNLSGFAYLVNATQNLVLDYKLLNNHHKAVSGDFSIQFISKHVVDLMWLPDNGILPVVVPPSASGNPTAGSVNLSNTTSWYAAVTGPDMTKHGGVGGYNDAYGLQATLGVSAFGGGTVVNERPGLTLETAPTAGFAQTYNNDEGASSGTPNLTITCAGIFQRDQIMTGPQALATANGGWARRSVIPLTDQFAGANTPKIASGAIVYRADTFISLNGTTPAVGLQIETGGHLNSNANHVNRPY